MPEIVVRDHHVKTIKEGDTLFSEKVVEVKTGTKYVHVRLENPVAGKTWYRFDIGDVMEVGKSEPTAEELLEKEIADREFEREYFVTWCEKQAETVDGMVERAIADLDPSWLRYNQVNDLLFANAYHTIYGTLANFLERAKEQKLHKGHLDGSKECEYGPPDENHTMRCVKETVPTTAYDGCEMFVEWLRDDLVKRAYNFRAISRSTSTMDNLMEDIYLEALGKVCRDMKYKLPRELHGVLPDGW